MTPTEMPGPLQSGALLAERYHIELLLRTDASGRRYLAKDLQDGMRALLLQELFVLPFPADAARHEAAEWLAQQVARVQRLAQPGITGVCGLHVPPALNAPFYVALDHIPGMTLAEEYEEADGELSWRQPLDWGIALCDVLGYLHAQKPPYILGSLRPWHVALDSRSGRPVLIDFGLAHRLNPANGCAWGYMPFEQLIGREDARSDLYALGATLHALLSGYDAGAEFGRLRRAGLDMQRALRQLHPRLDAITSGIPAALDDVVARALAFTPDDRFPDAGAMGAALRALRGPAVESETPVAQREVEGPVWERLGLTQRAWFALPLAERNRRLLGQVHPPPPEEG
jgi:serine/threonine protein kinase